MAYEQIATVVKYKRIDVAAGGWLGSGPHTKGVTITGATSNSMVDIQADAATIGQMQTDGVTALYIVNNNGTFTLTAVGAAPTQALSFQVSITEVVSAS